MKWIDEECGVVPLNALVLTPTDELIKNSAFTGIVQKNIIFFMSGGSFNIFVQLEVHAISFCDKRMLFCFV